MRELFSSNSFKKLICVLVAIVLVMCVSTFSDKSIVSSVVSFFTTGLQQVSAAVSKEAGKPSYDELLAENNRLNEQLNELRTELVDYYEVKEENSRLWKYYDLKQTYPSYELMPASVIRRDPSDNFYSFTVNKGTSDKVCVGDPVLTDKGLIGWVSAVDLNTARVKTILSPDAKVGSVDAVSRDSGIVTGSISLADQNLTTMQKLPEQNTMVKGDIVISTGISGLYPPSQIIGEVVELKFDEYDTSTYAVIKPFEDIRTVTDVVIVTAFDGQGEFSEGDIEDVTLHVIETTAPMTTAPLTSADTEE